MRVMIKAIIFDLDGVLVDTAIYHYYSWKKIANSLGIDFTEKDNEQLKGVSRRESLEYILKLGRYESSEIEKERFCALKNSIYIDYISNLDNEAILPGALNLLNELKEDGIKIALGSASKNSMQVLKSTGILSFFDAIADGNRTNKSKPDPEVFLIAAKNLNLLPEECVVIEDSIKGIEGAIDGGFKSIGVGTETTLGKADMVVSSLENLDLAKIKNYYMVKVAAR
jgi:beta-phosphoglucomutase